MMTMVFFILGSDALGLDKVIKAPSGKVIIGATANVRTSEGTGTTTLTGSDAREQIFNLSAARTVKLPTTGIKAGETWFFKNVSTGNFALTIQPSGNTDTLATVWSKGQNVKIIALQDTPTTASHWSVNFVLPNISLSGLSQKSGSGGYTYSATNGNGPTLADNPQPMLSISLDKGIYLVSFSAYYKWTTAFRNLIIDFRIGGSSVGSTQGNGTWEPGGNNVGNSYSAAIPVVITSDSTSVAIYAWWETYGYSCTYALNEMWAIKLFDL